MQMSANFLLTSHFPGIILLLNGEGKRPRKNTTKFYER